MGLNITSRGVSVCNRADIGVRRGTGGQDRGLLPYRVFKGVGWKWKLHMCDWCSLWARWKEYQREKRILMHGRPVREKAISVRDSAYAPSEGDPSGVEIFFM